VYSLYLGNYISCIFPVEGEVAKYTLVKLLYKLHNQGFRIQVILEECKNVLFITLILPQIIIS
jgi:hypothetical protein